MRFHTWAWPEKGTTSARCRFPGYRFCIQVTFSGNENVGRHKAEIIISCHLPRRHGMGQEKEQNAIGRS